MNRAILYGMPAVTGVGLLAASAALVRADSADSNAVNAAASSPPAAPCQLEMTHAEYGFQCLGSSSSGSTLEPVSFVGTVSGDGHGFFEAFGTFNSSNGSLPLHWRDVERCCRAVSVTWTTRPRKSSFRTAVPYRCRRSPSTTPWCTAATSLWERVWPPRELPGIRSRVSPVASSGCADAEQHQM